MSFAQSAFGPGPAWSNRYLQAESLSLPTTTTSGAPTEDLSQTATSFQHENLALDDEYPSNIPRYVAPYQHDIQYPTHRVSFQGYQVDRYYTTSYSNSLNARGRTASDGSTDFTDLSSACHSPALPFFINGADTQQVTAEDSNNLHFGQGASESSDSGFAVTPAEETDNPDTTSIEEEDAEEGANS